MFDWISGKKDAGQLTLSEETRKRLEDLAQSLNQAASEDGEPASAESVLDQLLRGELSLVSAKAQRKIALTNEGYQYRDQTFSPPTTEKTAESSALANQNVTSPPASVVPPVPQPTESQRFSATDEGNLNQVSSLQQQIEMLQNRLNQRRDQQAAQQAKIASLIRKNHQQEQEIASLKAQTEELRQAAAIGEAQLNRWRFNNFSR